MSYPGSKAQAGVFQRIIGQMPPHTVYVEPFFGSGQVFWRKRRAASTIVIDRVPGLLTKAGAEAGVQAVAGDALDYLTDLIRALPSDAVVYCDPPYLLSTRQGRFYYDHEMTDQDHARFLTLLQALPCRVLVSHYPCELYGAALQSWRCIRYLTMTRGGKRLECLWANFPEPTELHDWRYAGQNFRQRTALKRLAVRWLKRLDAMPPRKRGYVLDAIAQRQNGHCPRPAPDIAVRDPALGPRPATPDAGAAVLNVRPDTAGLDLAANGAHGSGSQSSDALSLSPASVQSSRPG